RKFQGRTCRRALSLLLHGLEKRAAACGHRGCCRTETIERCVQHDAQLFLAVKDIAFTPHPLQSGRHLVRSDKAPLTQPLQEDRGFQVRIQTKMHGNLLDREREAVELACNGSCRARLALRGEVRPPTLGVTRWLMLANERDTRLDVERVDRYEIEKPP